MAQLKEGIKSIGLKYGLYLGVILSVLTLAAISIDWDILLSPWFQFTKFFITVGLAVWGTYQARLGFPKKFDFRDGFSAFFITIAVGLAIFTLANWFLYNYVFIDAGIYINDTSIQMREEQMKALDQDPENIKREIDLLKESFQFSFVNQFRSYFFNLVLYCLLAPIAALIFKTKKPIVK